MGVRKRIKHRRLYRKREGMTGLPPRELKEDLWTACSISGWHRGEEALRQSRKEQRLVVWNGATECTVRRGFLEETCQMLNRE